MLVLSAILIETLSCEHGLQEPKMPEPAGPVTSGSSSIPVRPTWLGSYDAWQREVLTTPVEAPIDLPAAPVYPDPARFTFIGEARISAPKDLIAYADFVANTLDQSRHLYVTRISPEVSSNTLALFGPQPALEADLWTRVVVDEKQLPRLVQAPPSDEARTLLDKAKVASKLEALGLLGQAAKAAGPSPGVHVTLAEAALGASDLAMAEQAAKEALKLDPAFASAHRVLSEILLRKGDRSAAKTELAQALAYYPLSPRAWKTAEAFLGVGFTRPMMVMQPFIDVSQEGAVVVVSCDRPFCERYAACKAAFRYEPEVRRTLLRETTPIAYHLSVTEEVVCIEAGLGAHLQAKSAKNSSKPVPDPSAELLMKLASERGLTAFALFELLGMYRPEWLRIAPSEIHDAIVEYALSKVLGGGAADASSAKPVEASASPPAERR